jgi:hypothetical protein
MSPTPEPDKQISGFVSSCRCFLPLNLFVGHSACCRDRKFLAESMTKLTLGDATADTTEARRHFFQPPPFPIEDAFLRHRNSAALDTLCTVDHHAMRREGNLFNIEHSGDGTARRYVVLRRDGSRWSRRFRRRASASRVTWVGRCSTSRNRIRIPGTLCARPIIWRSASGRIANRRRRAKKVCGIGW